MRVLITGWCRGGLGYLKALLEATGYSVGTSLDLSLTPDNLKAKVQATQDIEISSAVMPFIHESYFADAYKIFVVRDPMRVLNSLKFHGIFQPESPATKALYAYSQNISVATDPLMISYTYIQTWWKQMQSVTSGITTIKIEEHPHTILNKLQEVIPGFTYTQMPFVSPLINSSGCRQNITPSNLPAPCDVEMLNLLRHLKYHEYYWFPRGGPTHYVTEDWHC